MSAREKLLGAIRRSLGVTGQETPRRAAVDERIARHPAGVVPARGQREQRERRELFRSMVVFAAGTVEEAASYDEVPALVAQFLRAHNLPSALRRGADPRLEAMPWERARALNVAVGPSDGSDLVGLSHAFAAAAETGTLMLASGPDNPTTLNFLPDTHIVVVNGNDIVGDYEGLWERLRQAYGPRTMPRVVNWITGPSRSADIEQTLILGAHGPRRLHVIVVGGGDGE